MFHNMVYIMASPLVEREILVGETTYYTVLDCNAADMVYRTAATFGVHLCVTLNETAAMVSVQFSPLV